MCTTCPSKLPNTLLSLVGFRALQLPTVVCRVLPGVAVLKRCVVYLSDADVRYGLNGIRYTVFNKVASKT